MAQLQRNAVASMWFAVILVTWAAAGALAEAPEVPATDDIGHAQHVHGTSHQTFVAARSLQQANALPTLPRVVIGGVQPSQSNSYTWSIQRQSSASGIAVTADGNSRKQLGYTLTFTRNLQKSEFRLQGVVTVTGQGSVPATLDSISILAAGRTIQSSCQGMPGAQFTLQPGAVIECPFETTWTTDPGADVVTGYVQTSFGRATATGSLVPFSFAGCSSGRADGGSCSVVDTGGCVSVTDGAYIINKYKDRLGQQLSPTVTRSRLFETSSIQDSTLGPPRIEPTTPAITAAVARVPDTPAPWTPRMPDSSWWGGGHRRMLLQRSGAAITPAGLTSTSTADADSSRRPLAITQSKKDDLSAVLDDNFKWPYPTITGDRPPVGLDGRPARGSSRQICGSRTFAYGMVFGPLLPAACGTFEVQNNAAALPTDNSGPAVRASSYTYLQVLCPAAVQERASRQVGSSAGRTG